MRCPKCSFENPPGQDVCQQCGTALVNGPASESRNATKKQAGGKLKFGQVLLCALVILSLALNGLVIFTLYQAREAALGVLESAQVSLFRLTQAPIVTQVKVDQDVPINTTIPIQKTFTVPLDFDYPLSTVVNTSINIPVLGRQDIAVPIDTIIPIKYDVEIPVQTEIPISFTYRLQADIPVEVALPPETVDNLEVFLEQLTDFLK